MRKLLHVERHVLEHGHGGVIHQEPESWRGGSERSHAIAVLKEFHEPGFQASHENLMRVHAALIHLVLALTEHTQLPKTGEPDEVQAKRKR